MTGNSDFLTWDQCSDYLRLKDFELFKYLKKGLPIYIKCSNLVPCPGKYHRYRILQNRQNSILEPAKFENYLPNDCNSGSDVLPNHTTEDYERAKSKALEKLTPNLKNQYLEIESEMSEIEKIDPDHISWKYFEFPSSDWEIEELIEEYKNYYFSINDVAKYMNLYQKRKKEERINDSIEYIFAMAGPQLEKLYSIMLNKFGCWNSEDPKIMREFVISEFKQDRDGLNWIKLSYLEDDMLYEFRERHAREDFIGKLLKKICRNSNLDKKNAQAIYKDYVAYKKATIVE